MTENSLEERMRVRRERVERARAEAAETVDEPTAAQDVESITDFWKLPKTGVSTTLLNSAWTWTLISYVTIMAIGVLSVAQQGSDLLDTQSDTARIAIAVGLIYPAWRIGSLISKFMKKRGIGAGFSVSGAVGGALGRDKPAKAVSSGSVEARMAERKARLEKARQEGKI